MKLSAWETFQRTQMEKSDLDRRFNKFLDHYNTRVVNSGRRTIERPEYRFFTDPTNANMVRDDDHFYYRDYQDHYNNSISYERTWLLEMPESALNYLTHMHERVFSHSGNHDNYARMVIQKQFAEHEIRSKVPAVQAAWEQYSLMLHLASNGKDLP